MNRVELHEQAMELLTKAQQGNVRARDELIVLIGHEYMNRRIGRYLSRNRQVDNEDIKQEFMIGVSIHIADAKMDIGDPIEYLLSSGTFRVRSYFRKMVIQNTVQVCADCGHKSRLNRLPDGHYQCKKCGSINVTPVEVDDHNEFAIESEPIESFEDEVISRMMMESFESTLTPGTNIYNLYKMLTDGGIDRDNPLIKNYISTIADVWDTSNQNVVQNIKKLKRRFAQWASINDPEYTPEYALI